MISLDDTTDTLVTLVDAKDYLEARGIRVALSTLYRWQNANNPVYLETIYVGGVRYTSHKAMQRFFEARTRQKQQKQAEQ